MSLQVQDPNSDSDSRSEDGTDEGTPQSSSEKKGPTLLARQSLQIILRLLCERVPLEIALQIVNFAEIHPCSILASRHTWDMEMHSLYSGRKTYLTAQIPFYENPRGLKNFKTPARDSNPSPSSSTQIGKGRIRIIDKLVFRIRPAPVRGAPIPVVLPIDGVTFVEVELWRRKYHNYKDDIMAKKKMQMQAILDCGGDPKDLDLNYTIKARSCETWNKAHHDFYHGYSRGGPEEETRGPNGKFKVGTWFLHTMDRIYANRAGYVTSWDWRLDEPMYIESEDADGNGTKVRGKYFKPWDCADGKIQNGAFIRELREGDEIKVVIRALGGTYTRCVLGSCDIECWWAL
ncbi:hypothetical protein TWF481_006698 [Arthrobotrys musiformis]|uniref:F-box domain-containing protein n=1 Tax=Arthrobotrys musiformis TaxID=47236 RepID=A0AAV9WA86_9PEZI